MSRIGNEAAGPRRRTLTALVQVGQEQLLAMAVSLTEAQTCLGPAQRGGLAPAQPTRAVAADGDLPAATQAGNQLELGAPQAASPAQPLVFADHAPDVAILARARRWGALR